MKNKYEIRGDATAIFITKGDLEVEMIIDTDVLPLVSSINTTWFMNRLDPRFTYAIAKVQQNLERKHILMHRLIMNCPDGYFVDHINHNTLDNRKSNLRIVSKGENNRNLKGARKDNRSTGTRGVWKIKNGYLAGIMIFNKRYSLGTFLTKEEAEERFNAVNALVNEHGDNFSIDMLEPYLPSKEMAYKNNKNNMRNVYWDERYQHWYVKIYHNQKAYYVGSYNDINDANEASIQARKNKHLLS